eukprot:10819052-Alexandrium_andersonii.AAC.1
MAASCRAMDMQYPRASRVPVQAGLHPTRASHSHLGSACLRKEAYAGQHHAMWRRVGATSLPQSAHRGAE